MIKSIRYWLSAQGSRVKKLILSLSIPSQIQDSINILELQAILELIQDFNLHHWWALHINLVSNQRMPMIGF